MRRGDEVDYQTIEDWRRANPFQPFRLVMTDGRTFDIAHPNLVWPGRVTVLIGIQDPAEPVGVFGQYISAAIPHVIRVEPVPVGTV